MMKKGTCKHFTGYQNGKCNAGVNYRELVGGADSGWMARGPCIKDSKFKREPVASCDKFEEPSAAEITAAALESKVLVEQTGAAIRLIRSQNEKQGLVPCPRCEGKLGYSVASNGHIWGKCETHGCLAWMM